MRRILLLATAVLVMAAFSVNCPASEVLQPASSVATAAPGPAQVQRPLVPPVASQPEVSLPAISSGSAVNQPEVIARTTIPPRGSEQSAGHPSTHEAAVDNAKNSLDGKDKDAANIKQLLIPALENMVRELKAELSGAPLDTHQPQQAVLPPQQIQPLRPAPANVRLEKIGPGPAPAATGQMAPAVSAPVPVTRSATVPAPPPLPGASPAAKPTVPQKAEEKSAVPPNPGTAGAADDPCKACPCDRFAPTNAPPVAPPRPLLQRQAVSEQAPAAAQNVPTVKTESPAGQSATSKDSAAVTAAQKALTTVAEAIRSQTTGTGGMINAPAQNLPTNPPITSRPVPASSGSNGPVRVDRPVRVQGPSPR